MSLGFGIVGLRFGLHTQAPSIELVPGCAVRGFAGSDPAKARETVRAAGWDVWVGDWRDLVQRPDVDVVCVATPPSAHAEITCAALAAGKHVLCEKPFGISLAEADRMCAARETSRRFGWVDFGFRYDPLFQRMKDCIDSGLLGRIQRIDVRWFSDQRADPNLPHTWQYDASLGGGILGTFGSHVIDYVEWLAGSAIVSVSARSTIRVLARPPKGKAGEWIATTAPDEVDFIMETANGVRSTVGIGNTIASGGGQFVEVLGDRAAVAFSIHKPYTSDATSLKLRTADGLESDLEGMDGSGEEVPADPRIYLFRRLITRIAAQVRETDAPFQAPADFTAGRHVRLVMDAIEESARTGEIRSPRSPASANQAADH